MSILPACCIPTDDASPAERAYCAYNAAGDPATAGLNFRGEPCPTWAELPANVRTKWEDATAAARARQSPGAPFRHGDVVQLRSGGPNLTVNDPRSGMACCVWFDEAGGRQLGDFTNEALRLVRAR
jgi:uncharacterized protein YodC (DUF2158 family)